MISSLRNALGGTDLGEAVRQRQTAHAVNQREDAFFFEIEQLLATRSAGAISCQARRKKASSTRESVSDCSSC